MLSMSRYKFSIPGRHTRSRTTLAVESLENRLLLDCAGISGFVYHDLNNNGLHEAGESPLANAILELRDSSGALVATTTTNDRGFYNFETDPRSDAAPVRQQHDIVFAERTTGGSVQGTVPQFDPSLGTLVSVEIQVEDKLVSVIKIENLESIAATVFSNVTGTSTIGGPSLDLTPTELVLNQSFFATAYDGNIDFGGTSGKDYGQQVAGGTNKAILTTPEEIAPYIGTGTVTISERTLSSANATGLANIVLQVNTTVSGRVRVIYHYIPTNCLAAGEYTVVLPTDPAGYIPGQKTTDNVTPIPGSAAVNYIKVTLQDTDATDNNFGEIQPAALSGQVYHDANTSGVLDPGDQGIAGATVTLTGVDDVGYPVTVTQTTAADGLYIFEGLRPGIYTLTEAQPVGFLDGKDTLGTQGGVLGNDTVGNIQLNNGTRGEKNNFGEVVTATLAGSVYVDRDQNGSKTASDTGIPGVLVTLTGIDDLGNPVTLQRSTGADGSFLFSPLRPGTYSIIETQPAGYTDGGETLGTHGGTASNDRIDNVKLPSNGQASGYDFGERLSPSGSGTDPAEPENPRANPPFSKRFLLASSVNGS
jgi:hypothetical protein